MEQLEQEVVGRQLHQRRAGAMAKSGIGAGDDIAEAFVGEAVADKGAHHAKGGFLVAETGQRRDIGA